MKAALWSICIIARQNFSHGDNVVSDGSPSRIRMVRRISLGMTTLPRSSILRTIPVAFISLILRIFVVQIYSLQSNKKYVEKRYVFFAALDFLIHRSSYGDRMRAVTRSFQTPKFQPTLPLRLHKTLHRQSPFSIFSAVSLFSIHGRECCIHDAMHLPFCQMCRSSSFPLKGK